MIEIDGRDHHGPLDRERDAARDADVEALGFDVWRIPYLQLLNQPRTVVSELRRRLAGPAMAA